MSDLPASMPKWIADHIALYRTDPDAAHLWDASFAEGSGKLPTLLLTPIGRNSGLPRPLPLIFLLLQFVIDHRFDGQLQHARDRSNLIRKPRDSQYPDSVGLVFQNHIDSGLGADQVVCVLRLDDIVVAVYDPVGNLVK